MTDIENEGLEVSENPEIQEEKGPYWLINMGPALGEVKNGETKSCQATYDNGDFREKREYFDKVKVGDPVLIAGVHEGNRGRVQGRGKIAREYDGETIEFVVDEILSPRDYDAIMKKMGFPENKRAWDKETLAKLSEYEYLATVDSDHIDPYWDWEFLNEVYLDRDDLRKLKRLLERKKNLIFQGPPGTGKTFAAKRLAYAMMGEKDDSQIEVVQFHPSYTYEDFVMGYRPTKDGFELREGCFCTFCKVAEENPSKKYFFIIDEINRGNVSKIFGELMMLIEATHRGDTVKLPYASEDDTEELFSIPDNLYIIGTMNTADRSLALIDYALRRRFSFFDMHPALDELIARRKKASAGFADSPLYKLVLEVQKLNKMIRGDESYEGDGALGVGFQIGHSYFCDIDANDTEELEDTVETEIVPLLNEYWFDRPDLVEKWKDNLERAVGIIQPKEAAGEETDTAD